MVGWRDPLSFSVAKARKLSSVNGKAHQLIRCPAQESKTSHASWPRVSKQAMSDWVSRVLIGVQLELQHRTIQGLTHQEGWAKSLETERRNTNRDLPLIRTSIKRCI